jgi:hypothetical protein
LAHDRDGLGGSGGLFDDYFRDQRPIQVMPIVNRIIQKKEREIYLLLIYAELLFLPPKLFE